MKIFNDNLKGYRELDMMVLDEINVHQFKRCIGDTEKGKIHLVIEDNLGISKDYNEDDYYWTLNNKKLTKNLKLYDKRFIGKILAEYYQNSPYTKQLKKWL